MWNTLYNSDDLHISGSLVVTSLVPYVAVHGSSHITSAVNIDVNNRCVEGHNEHIISGISPSRNINLYLLNGTGK
jgi:hypothetical protein